MEPWNALQVAVQKAQDGGEKVDIAAFQSLSTRKRKNVTESNASVPVKIFLFDLLFFKEPLIGRSLLQRRQLLQEHFQSLEVACSMVLMRHLALMDIVDHGYRMV